MTSVGMPEEEFLSVCAYEYTHTWLNERATKTRQLLKDTIEGFCELAAYKVSGKLGLEREEKRILQNSYTHGQIDALVTAEKEYGFHRLVRWITDGVDSWVDTEKMGRILVLREGEARATPDFHWIPEKPTPVPDKLVLKGLSGNGARRYALINNATLSAGEETRVRVATSNVLVRCLSITSNAVLIQVRGGNSLNRGLTRFPHKPDRDRSPIAAPSNCRPFWKLRRVYLLSLPLRPGTGRGPVHGEADPRQLELNLKDGRGRLSRQNVPILEKVSFFPPEPNRQE